MLKIEIGRGTGFKTCEVHYMEIGYLSYVGFKIGDDWVTVTQHKEIMAAEFEELTRLINLGLSQKRLTKSDQLPSPAQVVSHFKSSPELAQIAPDVERLLGPVDDLTTVLEELNPAALVVDGQAVYGAKSQIAMVLGVPCAGSYMSRINTVLDQIISTTTLGDTQKGAKCA